MWAFAIAGLSIAALLIGWLRSGRSAVDFFGLAGLHVYAHLWHRCTCRGRRHIPLDGPVLFVANHTCSSDPAMITHCSPRVPGFLIAKEYYDLKVFQPLLIHMNCVPTLRNGHDVLATRDALRRLRAGGILGIFPEGNLSNAGRRKPRPGKPGVAYLALRSRAAIVPVLIRGGPQTSDVLPAWVCPSAKTMRLTFGRPLDLSAYYERPIDRRLLEEVTNLLMRRVEELDESGRHGLKAGWPSGRR
jgi:1-acyl-sn-glycerol-3-phosphate acyltransferase